MPQIHPVLSSAVYYCQPHLYPAGNKRSTETPNMLRREPHKSPDCSYNFYNFHRGDDTFDVSYNKVLKKVPVGTITKDGQEITISVATETTSWIRPTFIALIQGPGFQMAVQASMHLIPLGTKDICQR